MVSKPIIGGIASIITVSLAIILKIFVLPPVIKQQIAQQVAIQQDAETFKFWETLPVPVIFKVYLFNVTNPDAIHRGIQKPIVKEIGPYVYRQYRRKEAKFSEDKKKVIYRQRLKFYFDKTLSAPLDQDDEIVMVDAFLNVVLQSTEAEVKIILKNLLKPNSLNDRNPFNGILSSISQLPILNSVLQSTDAIEPAIMGTISAVVDEIFGKHESLFMKTTPRKILFGGVQFCKNPSSIAGIICDMIKQKNSKTIRVLKDGSMKFSFFHHKNATDDGLFEASTGVTNVEHVGEIVKWNSLVNLNVWPNNTGGSVSICNMINGSDASNFRPYQTAAHNFPLYSFSTDICRSSELVFKQESEFKGIPALRYEISDTFLYKLGPEYSSGCFCVNRIAKAIAKPNGCLYQGALDLSPCLDAPLVLTAPHMMNTAIEYTSLISGQHPNLEKHQIFLEIEPNTGTPLHGTRRVQFNMFIRKIDQIDITKNLKTTLMPLFWVDEGIALSDDLVEMLNNKLIRVLLFVDIVIWVMIVGGVILGAATFYWYYRTRKSAVI